MLLLAAKAFTSYTTGQSFASSSRAGQKRHKLRHNPERHSRADFERASTLLKRLTNGGIGGAVKSLVGPGPNEPVPPDQLQKALGSDVIDKFSSRLGCPATS